VEVLKERLQRQADIAARAELALTQLAVSSQATQSSLAEQLEEAKEEAGELAAGRKELEAEYERLRAERQGLKSELAAARVGRGAGRGVCGHGHRQLLLSGAGVTQFHCCAVAACTLHSAASLQRCCHPLA
jgi:hypothetical protein